MAKYKTRLAIVEAEHMTKNGWYRGPPAVPFFADDWVVMWPDGQREVFKHVPFFQRFEKVDDNEHDASE